MISTRHILEILGSIRYWPQRSLFYEKRMLLKKMPLNILPHPSPISNAIPFLSVLHQNKALHSFCKRGQCSIVEHNIGLEYALVKNPLYVLNSILALP